MDKVQVLQYFVLCDFLLFKAQTYQKFTVKKEELNVTEICLTSLTHH
jgi:hypothetical protein